jgi:hypothetical protein
MINIYQSFFSGDAPPPKPAVQPPPPPQNNSDQKLEKFFDLASNASSKVSRNPSTKV